MPYPHHMITDPATVEFIQSRWDVTVRVTGTDGSVREWVVSADGAYMCGSGVWFGTRQEHDEEAVA